MGFKIIISAAFLCIYLSQSQTASLKYIKIESKTSVAKFILKFWDPAVNITVIDRLGRVYINIHRMVLGLINAGLLFLRYV